MHVRSPRPDARPLLITHGFPSSVAEFLGLIGLLTEPRGSPSSARTRPCAGSSRPRPMPTGRNSNAACTSRPWRTRPAWPPISRPSSVPCAEPGQVAAMRRSSSAIRRFAATIR
ncbi:epoxide hydrolase N-terminal domain-containing protein [Nocardia sp. NPDC056611]|uniref:epoxide hydrolase N-terminal domain-containing protein n=1 Tax=Nocardia sp. NPDC056611 TaxID=3345877 RepID=UPI00366ECEB0